MNIAVVVLLVVLVSGVVNPAQDTGYPDGLLADCPGMNNTTTFSEATRKKLHVVAKWPEALFFNNWKTCKLSAPGAACAAKKFDFHKRKTVILISGYMDASFSPVGRITSQSYLDRGYNVVLLEVFPILVRSYPIAARVTRPLGQLLGDFMTELTALGLKPQHLELVGGSLGAHVAAYACRRYTENTGYKPARLTGLDPAGPCFRNVPEGERFNADAAQHVDALHTNIDGFGIADAMAHVDFYANGGEYQQAMISGFLMPCFQFCSHVRSATYWYFADLHPHDFIAVKCESIARARHGDCYDDPIEHNYLGPKTNFSKPGIYYLPTKESMPYAMGMDGMKQRKYRLNEYLMQCAPEGDMIV